ncbi:ECF transporter S component [Candidatus Woesearchaeota archaeon]|nr:ECF transporter S component [Candidatus Woesearchaeota archaeon]
MKPESSLYSKRAEGKSALGQPSALEELSEHEALLSHENLLSKNAPLSPKTLLSHENLLSKNAPLIHKAPFSNANPSGQEQTSPSQKQRLIAYGLQMQLQALQLKEWLMAIGFSFLAAALRVPMQAVPSAEPITFFAILAGWLFGARMGFFTGAAAGFLSNFAVYGGQGPWTPFQMLSWGIAGYLGSLLPRFPSSEKSQKKNQGKIKGTIFRMMASLGVASSATVIFDSILNIWWGFFSPFGILPALVSGVPFFVVHLVSNAIFSLGLAPAKYFVSKQGHFDEKELCRELLGKVQGNKGAL